MKGSVKIFSSSFDMCDKKAKKNDFLKLALGMYALPSRCPIESKFTFCRNNSKVVKLSETTIRLLPMFLASGSASRTEVTIAHDTGKSCFQHEGALSRTN